MAIDFEKVITDKAEETRIKFRALLDKTNKEHPQPKDLKALSDLLSGNRKLELWRDVQVLATSQRSWLLIMLTQQRGLKNVGNTDSKF